MRLDENAAHDGTGYACLLAAGEVAPFEPGCCPAKAAMNVNPTLNATRAFHEEALLRPDAAATFHTIPTLTKDFPIAAERRPALGRLARARMLLAVARQLEDELEEGCYISGQSLPPVYTGKIEEV